MTMFYTMESVRNQIMGATDVRTIDVPQDWNRCPCAIEKRCEANGIMTCSGFVEIDMREPHFSVTILEIVFFRPGKKALVRNDSMPLRKLIDHGIVDPSRLVPAI